MEDYFTVSLCIEIPFFVFHISVFACILQQRLQRKAVFCNSFFSLYLSLSLADMIDYSMSLIYFRLARYGFIPQEAMNFPHGNLVHFLIIYAFYFQLVVHMFIAINRYSALTNTWLYSRLRYTAVALMLLLPLPGAAVRLLGDVTLVETATPGIFTVARSGFAWLFPVTQALSVLYTAATSLVSITFELRTLFIYRRLSAQAKMKYRNDFRLLVYALMQFVVQFAISVNYALMSYATAANHAGILSTGQYVNPTLTMIFCLSTPVCLFSTSKSLRKAYMATYWPLEKSTVQNGPTNLALSS